VQFVPMVAGVIAGSWLAGRVSARVPPARAVDAALLVATLAVALNYAQAVWLAPRPLTVVAPVALYAFSVALMMPNVTVMALDCFPRNRGMASAVQAFVQMSNNALVAGIVVPLVATALSRFALAQGGFLVLAAVLWRFGGAQGARR
jgi:DHA1 family bicyclomycin/chloramphenicol resistance-like MFS transporter